MAKITFLQREKKKGVDCFLIVKIPLSNQHGLLFNALAHLVTGCGICQCRYCRRQCKFFASGVNFFIFTHFFVFLSPKLLKLVEICGVKVLA